MRNRRLSASMAGVGDGPEVKRPRSGLEVRKKFPSSIRTRLGGVPFAFFSERRGDRSMMRSNFTDIREAHQMNKERYASIYKVALRHSGPPRLRQ